MLDYSFPSRQGSEEPEEDLMRGLSDPGSTPETESHHADPNRFIAYVWHNITLHDPGTSSEFEKFALNQLFPSVNTTGDPPDEHNLLNGTTGYVCLSRLTYAVHQTPLPVWLSEQAEQLTTALRRGLSAFGEVTPLGFYYDVAAWRQKLGD
jgi:hypothetical protein